MRKVTRKGWIRKLDKLCSEIVIARDKGCVCCGKTNNLQGGHLFSRVAYSTRWDVDNNMFAQCARCNLRHEHDPYPLMKYATNLLGQESIDELHYRYNHIKKFKDFELEDLYNELKKKLDKN